jgi:murein DD-endopeptidase MepM/ murein hydrolase activator NlpD
MMLDRFQRAAFFAALALLVRFSPAAVAADENPTGVRIVEEKNGDDVTISIESKYTCEFTVTVEATLENMTPSEALPLTVDAGGRNSFELVTFSPTDPAQPWRWNYRYFWRLGGRRLEKSHDAEYALPFGPGRYVVMQGPRGSYSHSAGSENEHAVDWTVPEGTTVCAAREGRVVGVKQDSNVGGPDRKFKPFGNYIIIKHADGTFADYVHLEAESAMVEVGDTVTVGQPIGRSGKTGFTSDPHLHFSVFQTIDGKKKITLPFRLKTDRGIFTEFIRGQAY